MPFIQVSCLVSRPPPSKHPISTPPTQQQKGKDIAAISGTEADGDQGPLVPSIQRHSGSSQVRCPIRYYMTTLPNPPAMHGLGLLFLQALSSVAHQALLCHNSTHIVEFWTAAAPSPQADDMQLRHCGRHSSPGFSLPHGSALSLAHFHVNRFLLMISSSERILHVIHTIIGMTCQGGFVRPAVKKIGRAHV